MDISDNTWCGVLLWWIYPTDPVLCSQQKRGLERVVVEYWNHGVRAAHFWVRQDLHCTWLARHRQRDRWLERSYTDVIGRCSSRWSCCWASKGHQSRGIQLWIVRPDAGREFTLCSFILALGKRRS